MFLFTVKISNALCWPISKDTKNFLNLLTGRMKPCIVRKKMFPQELSTTKCGAKLVTVTNPPVPRPPTTSSAFSQAKHIFFSTS